MPPKYEHWGEDYSVGIPDFTDEQIEEFKEDARERFVEFENPRVARWYTREGVVRAIRVIRAIQLKDQKWERVLEGFAQAAITNLRDLEGIDGGAKYFFVRDDKGQCMVDCLSGRWLELSETDLAEAWLNQANLARVQLRGANMRSCFASGVDLSRASLTAAKLQNANLRWSDLEAASFTSAKLHIADLSGCNLQKCSFTHARLYGANLERADLRGADLSHARMEGADLVQVKVDAETKLDGTRIHGAVLKSFRVVGADWHELRGIDAALICDVTLSDTKVFPMEYGGVAAVSVFPYEFLGRKVLGSRWSELNVHHRGQKVGSAKFEGSLAMFIPDPDFLLAKLVDLDLLRRELAFVPHEEQDVEKEIESISASVKEGLTRGWNLTLKVRFVPSEWPVERAPELKRRARIVWAWQLLARARDAYLSFKNNFLSLGRYDDASWCAIREKECERTIHWCDLKLARNWPERARHFLKWLGYGFHHGLSRYGEEPWRVFWWMVALVVLFPFLLAAPWAGFTVQSTGGHIGFVLPHWPGAAVSLLGWVKTYLAALYSSAITFSTLGYGDIQPATPLTRFFASVEAFTGIFLTAMFIWTLGRKVAGR